MTTFLPIPLLKDRLRLRWLMAALLICLPLIAQADEPTVEAVLETHVALPGEPVQFEIAVEGSAQARAPRIEVDGLEIRYVGPQTHVRMQNFQTTRSIIHHYEIIPLRTGEFTIPALPVQVGDKTLTTRPLKLTVNRSGSHPGGSDDEAPESDSQPPVFAEWVVPKETLYVGEVIPAELRLYVRSDIRVGLKEMPKVKADGLTLREFPREPKVNRIERDGRHYDVVTFKTAISAVKAGDLKLESTSIAINTQVQQRRPSQRQRRPRGFPDIFDDPFFNRHFGQTVTREVQVRAPEIALAVKSLPTEGRPADFSGAVGQFQLATKASPVEGKAGDPIAVTSTVSGSGSFQRMNAPKIAARDGWQVYPASGRFESDDDVEISGAKVFEQAVIPEGPATELPPITFSYFDPVQERYITLKGDPIPLQITGTLPAATPTPPATAAAMPAPSATPASAPSDILYIRTDGPGAVSTFTRSWRQPLFLGVQLIPLAALLFGGFLHWQKRRSGDSAHQRRVTLRGENQAARRALRDTSTSTARFFEEAVRAFQTTVALQQPEGGASLTPSAICAGRTLSDETRRSIHEAFERLDALRYGGAAEEPVPPERRTAILTALEELEKSHA